MIAPLGIAPLLALLAVALLAIEPRRRLVLAWPLRVLTILLAVLVLWGAASSVWSIIPAHSLFEAARLALLSAAGLVAGAPAPAAGAAGRARVGGPGRAGFARAPR